jgi:hypothetical protein
MSDRLALSGQVAFGCSSHSKEYQMTELKLHTATEAPKPVEKIVEPVKTPPVQVPPAHDTNNAKPIEVVKTEEKAAPAE